MPPTPLTRLATIAALAGPVPLVRAVPSDPVRNINPEEPIAPGDARQNPIYYVLPMGTVGEVSAPSPEALLDEFLNKHTAMNYPAAAEAAMRLIAAVPDRPVGYYNLACAMARMQRLDEAFDALHKAVEHGWRDVMHTNIDPDLATLRSDGRYAQLIEDLRARIDAERVALAPMRTDDWQTVAGDLTHDAPGLLERYGVPGATVALIRDGQVVWTASFGRRDVRSGDLMGVDDRFRLRAPLHLLAIAACQQLEDQQKVRLAQLIVDAANEHALPNAGAPQRTTRAPSSAESAQPVSQTANVRDSSGRSRAGPMCDQQAANVRTRLRSFSRDSVYGYLRLAVEGASRESFPRYCESSILQRLDLHHSGFGMPAEPEHVATGHSDLGTPLRPSVLIGEFAPGGCVYMSAGDLARLIASSLAAPAVSPAPALVAPLELASDEDAARRLGAAVDMVTRADAALSGSLGLALQRVDDAGGVRYQLDESASGIVCLARWLPQSRNGIVVLCNAAGGRDAAERIAHLALGGD